MLRLAFLLVRIRKDGLAAENKVSRRIMKKKTAFSRFLAVALLACMLWHRLCGRYCRRLHRDGRRVWHRLYL